MVELREVVPDMFEEIHRHLLDRLDPRIPAEKWRRLFNYPWRPSGRPLGHALYERGIPVGYLGLVFAPEEPGDGRSPVCNLTSWIVLDEHRGSALRLIAPVLARPDWTVTNFTPTYAVHAMFTGFGFKELESSRGFLPLRLDRALNPFERGRSSAVTPEMGPELDEEAGRIVLHHGSLAHYVQMSTPRKRGLLVYGLGRRFRLPTARIHHVTDPEILTSSLGAVFRLLVRRHGVCGLEFDRRLLGRTLPAGTILRRLPAPRLYRSPDRHPAELTDLFSEMILLDL